MRILLVEDDETLVELLTEVLSKQHYVVDVALDGETGWQMAQVYPYSLILLDINLPQLDGITFCRQLREIHNQTLVMLLTARDSVTDRIMGLNSGADDYVIKPFDVSEVTARIRALIRRESASTPTVLTCGPLQLDSNTREITVAGQPFPVSRKEYLLVELFLRHQQRVFSRSEIIDQLWSSDDEPPTEETVKSHIKGLRRKLKQVSAEDWIETRYGQGYRVNPKYLESKLLDQVADHHLQPQPQVELEADTPHPDEGDRPSNLQGHRGHSSSPPSSNLRRVISGSGTGYPQGAAQTTQAIWQHTRQISLDRIAFLEQTCDRLASGKWNDFMSAQAAQQAHQLAGSLGSFGFTNASILAREIEDALQSNAIPSLLLQSVQPLIQRLRQALSQADDPQRISPPTVSATILQVDDDPQILMLVKALLEPMGIRTESLADPTKFWDYLEAIQPDLLLLDFNMPQVNGLDICQAVRQNRDWQWLPIVFLTVQSDATVEHQIFAAGADDFVPKPIRPDVLTTRILNRLKRTQTVQARSPLNPS